MSKTFDATTKELVESDPRGWAELLLGRPIREARMRNVELSTISAEADSVLEARETEPWLVHVEFQTGYDASLPKRLQRYNILLNYRHDQPVQSVALLLCKEADGPALTGLLHQRLPDGFLYSEFRYNIVRIWEFPVEQVMAGELATLPLAPLAKLGEPELPAVIQRIHQRLDQEASKPQADTLWMATYLLMGLKYPDELVEHMLKGVQGMKESVTYQKILREGRAEGRTEGRAEGRTEGRTEGRAEEARRILMRLGTKRFGGPEKRIAAAVNAVTDLDRLEFWTDRLLDVSSWEELIEATTEGQQ